MDIQADINWIRSELKKVKDPHLIEAFKQMLTYRKVNQGFAIEALGLSLDRAIADKEAGRVKSRKEVRNKYDKWL